MDTPGADEAHLEELAGEGRMRAEEGAAREVERSRAARRAERRQVRRLGLGNLLNALVECPRVPQPFSLPRVMMLTAACCVLWLAGEWLELPRPVRNVGLAGVLLIPFAWFGGRRWIGLRLLRVERAWLQDLPFPVFGYFATLSGSPSEECTIQVRVWTRYEGPTEEVMKGMAGRADAASRVWRTAGGWVIESGPLFSPAVGDMEPTNGAMLSWMRSVIDEALLPLHAVHPLRSVKFTG